MLFEAFKGDHLIGSNRIFSIGGGSIRIEGEASDEEIEVYPQHYNMAKEKGSMYIRRICVVILAMLLSISTALADTSIFVATDRHAKYETESTPPDERAGRKPKKKLPVYDSDGNLIWHNHLTEVLSLVAADGVLPEIVLLGGDNVGDGGDKSIDANGYPIGAPYFSMAAVDAQVKHVFGETVQTLYTYGSHDIHATDPYDAAFFSGPVSASGYYVYGITFAQMIHDTDEQALGYEGKDTVDPNGVSAQAASRRFLSWVDTLEDHRPIIVMSHVPLHANRGDNAGAWTWTKALNAASESHDIFFLWGHNHTVEMRDSGRAVERANYLKMPGEALTVQSRDAAAEGKTMRKRGDDLVTQTEILRFVYMNAGYITNGVGTVLTFSDENENGQWDHLTARRYALEPEDFEPWVYALRE